MNYELVLLVSRLRAAKTPDDYERIKELAESMIRKAKNESILMLMTVAEELGDQEILDGIDDLKRYLKTVVKATEKKKK